MDHKARHEGHSRDYDAKERSPRGPAERGSGSGGDAGDRARILPERLRPATGSHLPAEETASPFAVYSRRRLSRIPSRKAPVAPAETCSEIPYIAGRTGDRLYTTKPEKTSLAEFFQKTEPSDE